MTTIRLSIAAAHSRRRTLAFAYGDSNPLESFVTIVEYTSAKRTAGTTKMPIIAVVSSFSSMGSAPVERMITNLNAEHFPAAAPPLRRRINRPAARVDSTIAAR